MMAEFLSTLTAGMLLILGLAPISQMSQHFLRLCGFVVTALGTLATVLLAEFARSGADRGGWSIQACGAATACGALVAVLSSLGNRARVSLRWLCVAGGLAALVASYGAVDVAKSGQGAIASPAFLHTLDRVFAALLLGGVTVAWLLGHAYLTATRMTMVPLRRLSGLLLAAVGARVLFALVSLSALVGTGRAAQLMDTLRTEWLAAVLRVGLGLVAMGIFAVMVRDCVRLRATQSATGILYFSSIFVYTGELAGQYLTAYVGWPV